jgi:hypothetical protein
VVSANEEMTLEEFLENKIILISQDSGLFCQSGEFTGYVFDKMFSKSLRKEFEN